MTSEEAITVMQLYKDELEHRIAIAKIDYDPGAIDLYSIQLDAFDVAIEALSADAVHDGCDGCRYEQNTEHEYPCKDCKQNYRDMWEQKPNDSVSVVRCKDCRHNVLTKDGEYNEEDIVCDYWLSDGLDSNDFCSYGERREP